MAAQFGAAQECMGPAAAGTMALGLRRRAAASRSASLCCGAFLFWRKRCATLARSCQSFRRRLARRGQVRCAGFGGGVGLGAAARGPGCGASAGRRSVRQRQRRCGRRGCRGRRRRWGRRRWWQTPTGGNRFLATRPARPKGEGDGGDVTPALSAMESAWPGLR